MSRRSLVRAAALGLACLAVSTAAACGRPQAGVGLTTPRPSDSAPAASRDNGAATPAADTASSPLPSATAAPPVAETVRRLIAAIDPAKLDDHMVALAGVGSRDPRHPAHAKAVAYLKEQLGAIGVTVESFRNVHQGVPLESLLVTIDPPGGPPAGGWVMLCAHYDSISNRTAGWNAATSEAPGADDDATGVAALLEYARILARERATLRQRVVLAFFDGEELFFKGSGAYVASLPKPYPYAAVVNIDMVGFNPLADRLDLISYTSASTALRDRVVAANERYATGIAPLVQQLAVDGNTILDAAPFGLAGVPAVALVERYGDPDRTYPGNGTFHTVNDTPNTVTNKRLWLKAAKLTFATALELALQ